MTLIGKQMSIGDLIAHHILTDSLGDIASVFSLLLEHDIFDLIANTRGGIFPNRATRR